MPSMSNNSVSAPIFSPRRRLFSSCALIRLPTPPGGSQRLFQRRLALRFRMYQRLDATKNFTAHQALAETHGVRREVSIGADRYEQSPSLSSLILSSLL